MTEKKFPEWLLWIVVLIWGGNYTVGKWGMLGFDPLSFTVLRFAAATPLLFLLLYLLEKNISVERKDYLELSGIGLIGITTYQTLFMATVKYSSATNASLLISMSPVFTAVFAWLSGQEKLSKVGQLGTLVSLSGATLVILFGSKSLATGGSAWLGNLIGVIASCLWGLYPVVSARMLRKYSALKTTTYSALFGTLFLLAGGFLGLLKLNWSLIPLASWGSLLYAIGPVTAYSLVVWYYGISKNGANRVMAYMYSIPVVAVLVATVVLGERIHLVQILGAVVIFVGIAMIKQGKSQVCPTEAQAAK